VLRRFGLFLLLWGGIVASAHAQGAAPAAEAADVDASDAVARGLFQAGAAAFEAGQFAEALEHFQAAYARSPRPKLLYNIGQAADRLRQDEVALDSFRRYLAEVPDAEGREAIEARVRVLEQAVSEKKAAEPPPEAMPTEPAPTEPSPSDPVPSEPPAEPSARPFPWVPVAVLGAGVVAMVAGAAFGMTAKSEEDDYALLMIADEDSAKEADDLLSDAESHATVANVLLGAGAALSAVATVWLVLELTDDGEGEGDAHVAAAPRLAPGELGFVLSGRFGGAP
jgi:tetratricopeptide (TPR) repeat protein